MIYIGADHRGYELKEHVKNFLERKGIKVQDVSKKFVAGDDYPEIAATVARAVKKNPNRHRGLLICGSGGGMNIAANKFKGVRAVLVESSEAAILSRKDDNANILVLGALIVTAPRAKRIVWTWLGTKFSGNARHRRRIAQIAKLRT